MTLLSFLDTPVFVSGHRKSGTTLLLTLLDNHPELTTYPPDSGFFYMFYPGYDSDAYSKGEKIDRMVERVIGTLKEEISLLPEENQNNINFPFDALETCFRDLATDTTASPKDMLISLIHAFHKTWEPEKTPLAWVEKTTSSEIYAQEIIEWFPKAKFLHIIRDPRDNWASLLSGWNKRYSQRNTSIKPLMQSMIDRGRLGMEFARTNEKLIGKDQYKIIKFETLTNQPEESVKEIAKFLGISLNRGLHFPTVCGEPWKGNNFDGHVFTGISNVNTGKWKDRISKEDAALMEFYFKDMMAYFDYPLSMPERKAATAAAEHYKWLNFNRVYQ